MKVGQLILEAIAAVKAQRVSSFLVAMLAGVMCLATILTVGRAVSAEREVAARLDEAGSRVLVVRDTKQSGLIPPSVVQATSALSVVERAAGLTIPIDVTNGIVGVGGAKVAAWRVVGSARSAATLTGGRWPKPGEALASETAKAKLGLADGVGWVQSGFDQFPVVGTFAVRTPFSEIGDGLIIAAEGNETAAALYVVATRANEAGTAQNLVTLLIKPTNASDVSIESPVSLAEIQRQVEADFGNFSRNILYGVLGAGALLIAIVVLADVLIRRKDLGRRRALGATRSVIVALVVLRTAIPALIGASFGAGAAFYLTTRWQVAPELAFTVATAVLAVLTSAASACLPAVFAARRDPVAVLRTP